MGEGQPRTVDAAEGATRQQPAVSSSNVSPLVVERGPHDAFAGNDARGLVQKAYDQLRARKQTIEAELARIEALRAEHEAVTAQVAALDEAMNAFQQKGERQSKAG